MSNCVPSLILSLVMGVLLATGADAQQDPTDTVSIGQDPAHQDDDDLLGGDLLDGDLLSEDESEPSDAPQMDPATEHARLFKDSRFPVAAECATCHPKQYREWSVSQHAYAQMSPLLMAMQNSINLGTSNTTGDFCLRCHSPVGSDLGEPFSMSNLDRHPASREGITCVICHRMSLPYRKMSGRIGIDQGDLFDPIKGPGGNAELARILSNPREFRVVTDREKLGRGIHVEVEPFFEMTRPSFCASCHEVFAPNGLRIEEVFTEYKNSPAADDGTSCNDCHMSNVQGVPSGYQEGPAAVIGGKQSAPRKLTNHYFAGPDYSVIHPGIFPINKRASEFKSLADWLEFDVDSGWGTDLFEDSCPEDFPFPDSWVAIDDRYEGREIIDAQLELLEWAKGQRRTVLENGFALSEPRITRSDGGGIEFEIDVKNLTRGHNVPTGFDAERLFVIQVDVTDEDGNVVFLSGDRDPNGDLRDDFSLYVHNGELPLDEQLFNLQSKFMTSNVRGGDREQVLPINHSVSLLPFVRPATRPNNVYGRPSGVRKHRRNIEPLGKRTARYHIDEDLLTGAGLYNIKFRFVSQAVPVNLVHNIMQGGIDYGMSPRELAEAIVAGAIVVDSKETVVEIKPDSPGR
ncbi:MAG TPA: hypothetical protein EYN40_03505 [Planctomycetes bacterium]|nr:hypothetical protein [Planctomycetota bacterium]